MFCFFKRKNMNKANELIISKNINKNEQMELTSGGNNNNSYKLDSKNDGDSNFNSPIPVFKKSEIINIGHNN